MRPQDPSLVASQYATEAPLEARRSIYTAVEGQTAREVAFAAIAETGPGRVLEVGGRHFVRVERRDVDAYVTVDPESVQRWVESLGGKPMPRLVDAPVRAHIACAVLVAEA